MKIAKQLIFNLGFVGLLIVLSGLIHSVQAKGPAEEGHITRELQHFTDLSVELASMHDLFSGGNMAKVSFDSHAAQKKGYSKESILLAEELADYTNLIIDLAKNEQPLPNDMSMYPHVQAYFNLASIAADAHYTPNIQTNERSAWINEYTCGTWWRPRPSSAKSFHVFSHISDPAATLKSWGYHETPGWAGGGWTRSHTYTWWLCGWNTYRDHAYIHNGNIHEQNYHGWTPRGEPNPEVHRSGPWPYPTWPAYVRWWHQTR